MNVRLSKAKHNSVPARFLCGWRQPRPVRRFAERLLSQQVWCWGMDIHSPEGNLLLQYGFHRRRLRAPKSEGSTCYRFDDDQTHVALWGFGLFYGERRLGGLYVGRFDFRPQWASLESLALGIHWPKDLPVFARPRGGEQWRRAHQLQRRMLGWIAKYERWVARTMGAAYREQCVAKWLHPFIASKQMPFAWTLLENRCWETTPGYWNEVVMRIRIDKTLATTNGGKS